MDQKQIRIFLADDDPITHTICRYACTEASNNNVTFTLVSNYTGDKVKKYVLKYEPDFIILDVKMPKANGVDVLLELKGDPATYHIPVVILTALSDEHISEEEFKSKGAAMVIRKSDCITRFHEILEAALNRTVDRDIRRSAAMARLSARRVRKIINEMYEQLDHNK